MAFIYYADDEQEIRDEFQMVKKRFDKEGGIIAYHGYQSFSPGEVLQHWQLQSVY